MTSNISSNNCFPNIKALMKQDTIDKLLSRKKGQRFCVKNDKLEVITGLWEKIKYFFTSSNNLNEVRAVISQAISSIDRESAIFQNSANLKELFYSKLSSLSPRVFDRNAITADVEAELTQQLQESEFAKESHASTLTQARIAVRLAYFLGLDLQLISQGSSGVYLGKDIRNRRLLIVKPSCESPYGQNTPKRWTRIVRLIQHCLKYCGWNLTRKSLRPNSEYMSEALAFQTNQYLGFNLVPETGVASFSSKAFYRSYGKELVKLASCQLWQNGMTTLASTIKKNKSCDSSLSQQLEDAMILGVVIGNQDNTIENIGLCDNQPIISFDNGLSFPQTHPRGYLSTRNQYGFAKLEFAGQPFSERSQKIIVDINPEALIAYLETNLNASHAPQGGILNSGQKEGIRDRINLLKKVVNDNLPIRELVKYKKDFQIDKFLGKDPSH